MHNRATKLFFIGLLLIGLTSVALTCYRKVILQDFDYILPTENEPDNGPSI
jgi:hypothetical protein